MLKYFKSAYQATARACGRVYRVAAEKGQQLLLAAGVGSTAVMLPGQSHAQTSAPTIDTSEVTTFLQDNVITGIAAIGGIMLLVAVVFAGYRWVRGAAGGN